MSDKLLVAAFVACPSFLPIFLRSVFAPTFPNNSAYFLPNLLIANLFIMKSTPFVPFFHKHLPAEAAPGIVGIIPPITALTATEFQLIQSNGLSEK